MRYAHFAKICQKSDIIMRQSHSRIKLTWLTHRIDLLLVTEYCDERVSLCVRVRVFVREHISETTHPTFTSLCACWPIPSTVAHGNGCDTLCTSGCIDDVMGGHTRACQYRCSEWRHRVVVRRLTPPLRRIGRVLSQTTADAEAGQVYRAGLGLNISR